MNQNDQVKQPAASSTGAVARWWKLVGATILIAAAMVVVLLNLLGPVPVAAVHPQRGSLVAEVFGTGTLEAKVVVSFSAKMIDKVVEVLVDQGDTVTDGQVLARLEATDYEHSVRVAEAGVGQAQAELAKARLDIARKRELLRTASISRAEFDTYEAAYRVGEAKLKNAEAQLGFTRARLGDTVIHSPVSGLVMTRNLEVGDTVVPGTPIFRIADTHQLWITAMVDERVAGNLRLGQPARVTFRAHPGQSFPGRLARLAEEADRVTEEREADVTVEQLPPDWFIGGKADVYIETARAADALQVPKSAVVPRDDQPGVFVINGGRARWQPVQLGLIGRDAVELVGGVDARELMITDPFAGKQPLADGQRVTTVATTGEAQ
jgi:HlyD family secretion protein